MAGKRSTPEQIVFYEAEVELKPHGTEEQLAGLASSLQRQWNLVPQPLPKFERLLTTGAAAGNVVRGNTTNLGSTPPAGMPWR